MSPFCEHHQHRVVGRACVSCACLCLSLSVSVCDTHAQTHTHTLSLVCVVAPNAQLNAEVVRTQINYPSNHTDPSPWFFFCACFFFLAHLLLQFFSPHPASKTCKAFAFLSHLPTPFFFAAKLSNIHCAMSSKDGMSGFSESGYSTDTLSVVLCRQTAAESLLTSFSDRESCILLTLQLMINKHPNTNTNSRRVSLDVPVALQHEPSFDLVK